MLDTSELAHRLRTKLTEAQAKGAAELAAGLAADHTNYRERCGYLRALRHVEEWITELSREINDPKF